MTNGQLSLFDIVAPKIEDPRNKEFNRLIEEGFRLLKVANDCISSMQELKQKSNENLP